MTSLAVKALVLTGYGINCDLETQYVFRAAGAEAERVHINRLIEMGRQGRGLPDYHILALPGGFSWGDDHGAGVLLGLKLRAHLGGQIEEFIAAGKLVIGICNGFQALVNTGLLPGFEGGRGQRLVALLANDYGNFRNQWVHLTIDPKTKCVFTRGLTHIDLPVRHGEGKFYAPDEVIAGLRNSGQVVLRFSAPAVVRKGDAFNPPGVYEYESARGRFPYNPNGSLDDIAGICDATGRVFGLMPHPEAFYRLTNHPDWTRRLDQARRWNRPQPDWEGDGLKIFRNAVEYVERNLL
ncbi:MAG: phosphoribosylformylglycinamidine synthase subunit PurQ [Thermodesulfobacteriota bacterium]